MRLPARSRHASVPAAGFRRATLSALCGAGSAVKASSHCDIKMNCCPTTPLTGAVTRATSAGSSQRSKGSCRYGSTQTTWLPARSLALSNFSRICTSL